MFTCWSLHLLQGHPVGHSFFCSPHWQLPDHFQYAWHLLFIKGGAWVSVDQIWSWGIAISCDWANCFVSISQTALIDNIILQFGQPDTDPISTTMDPSVMKSLTCPSPSDPPFPILTLTSWHAFHAVLLLAHSCTWPLAFILTSLSLLLTYVNFLTATAMPMGLLPYVLFTIQRVHNCLLWLWVVNLSWALLDNLTLSQTIPHPCPMLSHPWDRPFLHHDTFFPTPTFHYLITFLFLAPLSPFIFIVLIVPSWLPFISFLGI